MAAARKSARSPIDRAVVLRRLGAVGHAVVAYDMSDAQAIIGEHAMAAFRLRAAVGFEIAPRRHGRFVAPEGERDELAGLGEALEALDGDKAFDAVEQRSQVGGDAEIGVAVRGPDLEDDGDHASTL